MIKLNEEYWKKRFLAIESEQNKSSNITQQEIDYLFDKAQRGLDEKILAWYQRFAENNEISMFDARKLLNKNELREFKWDINDYIKHGKIGEQFKKELENASAKFHIQRFEALKIQMQAVIEELYTKQHDKLNEHLKNTYLDGYYKTAFEIQRGTGVGINITGINEQQLNKVLKSPWTIDNQTFSDRIWQDKNTLINELRNQLFRNILIGAPPKQSIEHIAKKMKTSRYNAARVVMTESAHIAVQAQKDSYNNLEVEKYKVLETLDSTTCSECGDMDGKTFETKELQSGVTAPPFHPFCRGTTIPYFDDNVGERAARDDEGNTYYVPANMTYNEWKEKYVTVSNETNAEEYNELFTNDENSDIISKNAELEISEGAKKSVSPEVLSKIQIEYDNLSETYHIEQPKIFVSAALPDTVPLQWNYDDGHEIIINKNKIPSDNFIKESNSKNYTTSKNIENLIQHEFAHILTFQNMTQKRMNVFDSELNEEISDRSGVSKYAHKDGAEYLAETFVKRLNGETLAEKDIKYLEKYIDKWRKIK